LSDYTIIPNSLSYKGAPAVDQEISLSLESKQQEILEYDRNQTISLAEVYDNERQQSTIFRPTFKVTYLYANTYTGTTNYTPFQYNLYYVNAEQSFSTKTWIGYPQYYEFDFFRPDVKDQHINYKSISAYTYNWGFYFTYPYANDYERQLTYVSPNSSNVTWIAKNGIPFTLSGLTINGNKVISFECFMSHGLSVGEWVELSINYRNTNLFQVYSLGNGKFDSEKNVFNILNIGYTGTTFNNGVTGTFKRVVNPDNLLETRSKYYIRQHKILGNSNDVEITKSGFEKNVFIEERQFEFSSITPNNINRISQKTSSNAYNVTSKYDIDIAGLVDNQKRPLTNLYLSIIYRGYSGYFNQPFNGVGLKQGWEFNITKSANSWWNLTNVNSNTNIPVSSYTKSNYTFYYNTELKKGDIIDGDFCEWNDYFQIERVVSSYYHKIKYNQNVFQTTPDLNQNSPGFYYKPHNEMTIRVFSDYIEFGSADVVENIPSYAYYSQQDQLFRWRDLYTYGFIDDLGRGVNYPFLNSAQYPFSNVVFRLIPEGTNYNLTGINFPTKPIIDGCE
jgi:uncharacterized membrane protein